MFNVSSSDSPMTRSFTAAPAGMVDRRRWTGINIFIISLELLDEWPYIRIARKSISTKKTRHALLNTGVDCVESLALKHGHRIIGERQSLCLK